MTKVYAGIGSRTTPGGILTRFTSWSALLEGRGYHLRSGGAIGADKAFEDGVIQPSMKSIFRPRGATEASLRVAERVHPAWHMCDEPARRLHGRNVQIILGQDLQTPVKFVLAYTLSPNSGGTRTGLFLAQEHGIPIFNFAEAGAEEAFIEYYKASL